jgi:uncharacterized coiled-coil DUF342 family protein
LFSELILHDEDPGADQLRVCERAVEVGDAVDVGGEVWLVLREEAETTWERARSASARSRAIRAEARAIRAETRAIREEARRERQRRRFHCRRALLLTADVRKLVATAERQTNITATG